MPSLLWYEIESNTELILVIMFVFLQVSIAMAVFTVFFVPETKGKSLQEIQSMFGELEPKPTQIETISGDMEKS